MNENELIARNITLLEENKVLKEKLFHGECETADELREQIAELSVLMADAELSALLDQAEIARLRAEIESLRRQIANLECIMDWEAEKTNQALYPYPET